jgi:homospermidine synthase
MVVNLSVDTSSVDLMDLAKDLDAFYIDTGAEPWPGLYTDQGRSISERSNYALREGVLELRRRRPGGVTAVSCCGAKPGWCPGWSSRCSSTSPETSKLTSSSRSRASNGRA